MGGNQAQYTVSYESEPCEPGTVQSRQEQMRILRTFAETPELQLCGYYQFQKLSMRHNGTSWVLELEAIAPE